MAVVQSVIFKKSNWSIPRARAWLKRHKYVYVGKVHETPNYYRFRQVHPVFSGYYTVSPQQGIELIMGVR